jgi:hypothetical protein
MLTTNTVLLVIFSACAVTASASTLPPSLCKDNEEVFFSCAAKLKNISLCASIDASETTGRLTYRFGKIGQKVEMEYPSKPISPGNAFRFASKLGAKGGSEQLTFIVGKFTYTLYSYHWGGVDSQSISGVLVENTEKHIANIKCTNPDSQLGMYYLGKDNFHLAPEHTKHFLELPTGEFRDNVP